MSMSIVSWNYLFSYFQVKEPHSPWQADSVQTLEPANQVHRVRGLVGEFGVPGNDPRWQAVLARFLEALDRAGMEGCYWAAGEWWGAYPLSIQPGPAWPSAAPQLEALRR